MEVVHHLVPADGVHIRIKPGAGLELIALESQPLPLGKRVDHLAVGPHVGNIKGHRAFHAVEVVVQAGGSVHKQGRGDPVQIQLPAQIRLEVRLDELDGALKLVVGEGHMIALRDDYLAHMKQSFLLN